MQNTINILAASKAADKAAQKAINNAATINVKAMSAVAADVATGTSVAALAKASGVSRNTVDSMAIVGAFINGIDVEWTVTTREVAWNLRKKVASLLSNSKRYGVGKADILKALKGVTTLEAALAWALKVMGDAAINGSDAPETKVRDAERLVADLLQTVAKLEDRLLEGDTLTSESAANLAKVATTLAKDVQGFVKADA